MTELEAIKELELELGFKIYRAKDEALKMAISALKLQTPKKPKYIEDDYVSKAYHFECPFCGEEVERGDNHCDNCLQIIDLDVEE